MDEAMSEVSTKGRDLLLYEILLDIRDELVKLNTNLYTIKQKEQRDE